MFGIGAGEMLVIAILILIAVGPDKMPSMMRTLGKGMRDIRRTTNELRRSTGIDELLDGTDVRDPLGLKAPPKKPLAKPQKPAAHPEPPRATMGLSEDAIRLEQPPYGVDVDLAEGRAREKIVARKVAAAAAAERSEPTS
jgi:sec-independent protein translocase protein TatB